MYCGIYALKKWQILRLVSNKILNIFTVPKIKQPKSTIMTKNQHNQLFIASIAKALATAFNSLFFTDSKREFNRLKNFIAS